MRGVGSTAPERSKSNRFGQGTAARAHHCDFFHHDRPGSTGSRAMKRGFQNERSARLGHLQRHRQTRGDPVASTRSAKLSCCASNRWHSPKLSWSRSQHGERTRVFSRVFRTPRRAARRFSKQAAMSCASFPSPRTAPNEASSHRSDQGFSQAAASGSTNTACSSVTLSGTMCRFSIGSARYLRKPPS